MLNTTFTQKGEMTTGNSCCCLADLRPSACCKFDIHNVDLSSPPQGTGHKIRDYRKPKLDRNSQCMDWKFVTQFLLRVGGS